MTSVKELLRRLCPPAYRLHAFRRAHQVEQRIAEEQNYYECRAKGVTDQRPIGHRLREKLQSRGFVVAPKARGSLHILYATRPSNWEPHNIPPQLTRFGHVSTYYYSNRGFKDDSADWLRRRSDMDADLLDYVRELHRQRPIDLFLGYLSGWQTAPEVIRTIGAMGIVTCGYHWDDKLSFRGRIAGGRWTGPAAVAAAYDLNLTNAPSSIAKYEVEGGLALFWPEAANPEHFRPLEVPFEYDVSFAGGCYGYRPLLVRYLRRCGIEVKTFGPDWPEGSLSEHEMVSLYARSRINLGFGGIGYSTRVQCLKGRDFEVPMCGALYLTSENPELSLVYDCDREILTYSSIEECSRVIQVLLDDPAHCSEIRKAARKACVERHTWEERFGQLLTVVGLL